MQTFVPYTTFAQSLNCLDYKRLGKQRVETKQLLNALAGLTKGWVNHPAAKMWRGHEAALASYGRVCCALWIDRGYKEGINNYIELLDARNQLTQSQLQKELTRYRLLAALADYERQTSSYNFN